MKNQMVAAREEYEGNLLVVHTERDFAESPHLRIGGDRGAATIPGPKTVAMTALIALRCRRFLTFRSLRIGQPLAVNLAQNDQNWASMRGQTWQSM